MRVLKTGLALAITALMVLSSIGTASAQASTVVTTTTGGWLTDLDGNLLRDGEGYYVLTISSNKLAGDEVQVDLIALHLSSLMIFATCRARLPRRS